MKPFSLLGALALLTLSSAVHAAGQEPGSLLLFPEFDNRAGQSSLFTITNVNGDSVSGAIDVHLVYIDASNCLETDLILHMSPRDTVSFLTSAHVPGLQRGYAYGWAVDKVTHKLVDFDYLIGCELRVDGIATCDWSVQALAFQGKAGAGLDTDLDHDGKPDLNGLEYDKAPNRIYVPRFFGQWPELGRQQGAISDLILLQPLGPASNTTTTAAFLIWNDNEEVYSASYTFTCWKRQRLLTISGTFAQSFLALTLNARTEIIGMPQVESGWFEVRGQVSTTSTGQTTANPPIIGVLVECRPNSAADLPFVEDL